MGFVVEQHLKDAVLPNAVKKNQAVVYGKNEAMWKVNILLIRSRRGINILEIVCVGRCDI